VIFDQKKIKYSLLVGEGAFGKVRKCYQNTQDKSTIDSDERVSVNPTVYHSSAPTKTAKVVKKDKEIYAVKIQSKY